jgi:RNA polymerase sigma-70 factor (ECF subfamily)
MALADYRRSQPPEAETSLLRAERNRQVRGALALLSSQERHCLELRAEGLRYREIAEVLGLNISTVTTFVVRAVKKIARQVHE